MPRSTNGIAAAALYAVMAAAGAAPAPGAPPDPDAETPSRTPDAVLPDGSRYHGPLRDGLLHGEGKLVSDGGLDYRGGFQRGLFHGSGILVTPAGSRYEGEFRRGLRHGQGELTTPAGHRYQGAFEFDAFNGEGRLERSDGQVFEGTFVNGDLDGHGRYRDGDIRYDGEFQRSRFHGQGRYLDGQGGTYVGEFRHHAFTGQGHFENVDGVRYQGGFRRWQMHGEGRLTNAIGEVFEGRFEDNAPVALHRRTDPTGAVYEGEFRGWLPHGQGTFRSPAGDRYEGGFVDGEFHGRGVLTGASGERYEGEFEYGRFHGEGTLTFAAADEDGRTSRSGRWRFGAPLDPDGDRQRRARLEAALYDQPARLSAALDGLRAGDPERSELYLLGLAGDGGQRVFRREVEYLRDDFARRFDTGARSLLLVNDAETLDRYPLASASALRRSLEIVAQRMDLQQDILFLYLTSHGNETHELRLAHPDLELNDLPAAELKAMLDESGIRWRVVVVSACFSGGFVDALADENTLVITASRADRQSFGCADDRAFTYFGRALLEYAIPKASSFAAAFELATQRVLALERAEGKTPSLPQMHAPAAVLERLRAWRRQRNPTAGVERR